jgi:hypothetical protein
MQLGFGEYFLKQRQDSNGGDETVLVIYNNSNFPESPEVESLILWTSSGTKMAKMGLLLTLYVEGIVVSRAT